MCSKAKSQGFCGHLHSMDFAVPCMDTGSGLRGIFGSPAVGLQQLQCTHGKLLFCGRLLLPPSITIFLWKSTTLTTSNSTVPGSTSSTVAFQADKRRLWDPGQESEDVKASWTRSSDGGSWHCSIYFDSVTSATAEGSAMKQYNLGLILGILSFCIPFVFWKQNPLGKQFKFYKFGLSQ